MSEIVIDTCRCDPPALNARKIWEALFREVEAWKFKSLDSFLCDYDCFKNALEQMNFEPSITFYWEYDEGMSGYTNFWMNEPGGCGGWLPIRLYKIEVSTIFPDQQIKITLLKSE